MLQCQKDISTDRYCKLYILTEKHRGMMVESFVNQLNKQAFKTILFTRQSWYQIQNLAEI